MQSFQYISTNNLPLSAPNRPVSKAQSATKSIYWRLKTDIQDCLSLSFWFVQWPCKSIWLLKNVWIQWYLQTNNARHFLVNSLNFLAILQLFTVLIWLLA